MATTALIVEVLVIGTMTLIWVTGAVLLFARMPLEAARAIALSIRDFIPLLALPTLALTYTVGWLVNFMSERALKWPFQKRVRDRELGIDQYGLVRAMVLQQASSDHVHELQLDRHIVRLARGGVFNFSASAMVAFGFAVKGYAAGWWLSLICTVLAGISLAQWLTRYRAHYVRIRNIWEMLKARESQLSAPTQEGDHKATQNKHLR